MEIPQWFALVNHSFGRLGIPRESRDQRDLVLGAVATYYCVYGLTEPLFGSILASLTVQRFSLREPIKK